MFELVALHECDPKRVARFLTLNRERFRPYAPTRSEHYYTNSHWRAACKRSKIEWKEGRAYRFVVMHKNEEVIGKIDLDHIRRGPFSTGDFGYLLDRRHEGQSRHGRSPLHGLHRFQAEPRPGGNHAPEHAFQRPRETSWLS